MEIMAEMPEFEDGGHVPPSDSKITPSTWFRQANFAKGLLLLS